MSNRIVIIEDNLFEARHLQTYFATLGHEVTVVNTTQAVVATVEELNPALVVLAYQLADTPGFKLCKVLKRSFCLRSIPVIMYNAENNSQQMKKAYEAGASFYLMKGQQNDQMLQIVVESVFNLKAQQVGEPLTPLIPFVASLTA